MVNWDEAVTELTAPGAPFELTEQIVVGTPTKVFAATPNSLRELFGTARMRGDEPYLVYEDETWTYADLLAQIDDSLMRSFTPTESSLGIELL